MHSTFPEVETFKTQLAILRRDFICNTHLPDVNASVSFLGQFQGQAVLWKMNLATLHHYRLAAVDAKSTTEQRNFNCPFIEINAGFEGVYQIRVGLDLAVIDEPVIKKSIIMIRNYRRLAIGRIEFCGGNS